MLMTRETKAKTALEIARMVARIKQLGAALKSDGYDTVRKVAEATGLPRMTVTSGVNFIENQRFEFRDDFGRASLRGLLALVCCW